MKTALWSGLTLLGLGLLMADGGPVGAADDELKVGDTAPEFALTGTDGKTYRLADFRGKSAVVLAWFPKADTPGCTKECKSYKENGAALKGMNVSYFTISVDTVADNQKFAAKYGLDYPILSDPEKSVARAYGVLGPRGVAQRWTFYIDKDGVIREIDKKINTTEAALDAATKLKELGIATK
ncbi:MAG TPA: peroxiredoxin [Isosphaeraceae bacterium]|jgi:peroxiredoxin Q/BCP